MTLYIYRVGWTYPARNPITKSKYIKIPSCTRIPLGPVRPVDPTGLIYRLLSDRLQRLTGQTARAYQSDRSVLSNANFGRQDMPPDLWQSLRAKEHSSGPKLSKGDEYIGHLRPHALCYTLG